jgi:hypothetical protein
MANRGNATREAEVKSGPATTVAQHCLGQRDVAGQHGFEAHAQQFLAKLGVALGAVADGFPKVARQGHAAALTSVISYSNINDTIIQAWQGPALSMIKAVIVFKIMERGGREH